MEVEIIALGIAVFVASALQAATGIGFGVIAGPALLIALNDSAAIQISVMLNLLTALLLAPSLRRHFDRRLLKSLLIGLSIGSPIGLMIYLHLDVALLKLLAGGIVLFTLFVVLRGDRVAVGFQKDTAGNPERIAIGFIAGMMGSSLAMPGPVPAAWMAARGFDKDTIRATILVMFVFAYAVALLLQSALAGINTDSIKLTAMLVPSTIAGILAGHFLSSRISELMFRRLLTMILALTAILLVATIV